MKLEMKRNKNLNEQLYVKACKCPYSCNFVETPQKLWFPEMFDWNKTAFFVCCIMNIIYKVEIVGSDVFFILTL